MLIKLLGIVMIVAVAINYDRQRLRRAGRLDAGGPGTRGAGGQDDDEVEVEIEIVTDAVIVGIADVDPEPLASPAVEAIDPDAAGEAHRSVQEQRDRLPIRGKNLP